MNDEKQYREGELPPARPGLRAADLTEMKGNRSAARTSVSKTGYESSSLSSLPILLIFSAFWIGWRGSGIAR